MTDVEYVQDFDSVWNYLKSREQERLVKLTPLYT